MSNFGYTILGFGGGKAPPKAIAEDLTYSLTVPDGIEATDTTGVTLAFDPFNANKVLVGYKDSGNDGTVRCGTIDGDTITWGTAVEIGAGVYAERPDVCWDPNVENSFFVAWRDYQTSGGVPGAIYHAAHAGTVSGTAITVGTVVNMSKHETNDYVAGTNNLFNPNRAGQVVVACSNYDNGTRAGAAEVGISVVDGTTCTTLNATSWYNVYTTDATYEIKLEADATADKFFMAFRGGSDYMYIKQVTANSNNTMTLEGVVTAVSNAVGYLDIACDLNNPLKIVAIWTETTGRYLKAKVGTYSSESWTWGSTVDVYDGGGNHTTLHTFVAMDKNTPNKCYISWGNETNDECMKGVVGTIDGTALTLGTVVTTLPGNVWARISDLENDPHNPGRFFTALNHDSITRGRIVGHQIASFEA